MKTRLDKKRSFYPVFGAGILVLWLVINLNLVRGSLVRNLGFLAANHDLASVDGGNFMNAGLTDTSLSYLHRAAELLPTSSTHRLLGFAHGLRGEEDAALTNWILADGITDELMGSGEEAKRSGNYEAAQRWYERATTVEPSNAGAWLSLGQLHETQGEWQEAAAAYRTGTSEVPGQGKSDLWYLLARVLANAPQSTNHQEILQATDQAIQWDLFLYPHHHVQSHYLRGVSLRALGRDSEALSEFLWVIKQRPDDYWSYVNLGNIAWQHDRNKDTAEQMYLKALNLRQDDKWGFLGLAEVYLNTGREEEAMAFYRAVLEIDPQDQTAAAMLPQP